MQIALRGIDRWHLENLGNGEAFLMLEENRYQFSDATFSGFG
jgi:hypothetical protein